MKILIKFVLAIVIVALGYFVVESVMSTVRFNEEKDARVGTVVQRMKDIREVQRFYKASEGAYAPNFDSLINFAKSEMPVIKMIPDPEDTTFSKSIHDTIGFILVEDSLFGKRKNFQVNELRYIPFSNNIEFTMVSDTIKKGGVMMPVYEVEAINDDFLTGMDLQMIINLNDKAVSIDRFPGLKMGSLTEVSTDGNWE